MAAVLALAACGRQPTATDAAPAFDSMIVGGVVYDGSGGAGVVADIAIKDDRIAAVGDLDEARAAKVIDAAGMAVAPGFVNMLSWAVDDLIEDGRSLGDIRQGVTLEVFGEGWSMGPLTEAMKAEAVAAQQDVKYDIEWTTLGEYLDFLERKGVSPNIASYVGATTLRIHEVGENNVLATDEQLARMQEMVREAMREGALGVGSSLIYAPANFAPTEELIALVSAAAESGGAYISHIRSEAGEFLEAIDEIIRIADETGAPVEIYHFKASGRPNWDKMDEAIAKVEAARARGVKITADMYAYPASSTGLDAAMPLWVQEGGDQAWFDRLKDPEIRARVADEMRNPTSGFENRLDHAGGPEGVLLLGFRNPDLRKYTGMTLGEVARERGTPPEETAIDLVVEDQSRVTVAYFVMSEENIKKKIAMPWMSFGSDAGSMAPEGVFIATSTHPRAYGNFARVYAKYVREEKALTLEEAVRRMTSLPASNLKIRDRGMLAPGYYADVVVFDPATIQDHATFKEPHQLATGVRDVFVNGVLTLENEQHTGATAGRVVRGPGWTGWSAED
jgi:N-acyl-D-amino-acid deacylase